MTISSFKAIYPGSFDPLTNGHLDILDRSRKLFSEIIVLVAPTVQKTPLFTLQERVQIIREVLARRKGVKIDVWNGLIMDYARKHHVHAIIRGLRAASDFEYEFMMATMNKKINPNVETLFMMTAHELFFVSSSMINEVFSYGGDISPFVPQEVIQHLNRKKKL